MNSGNTFFYMGKKKETERTPMLKPALFSECSELGQSINGIFALIKEYSTIKEGNIAGALDDNPRWVGSMGVLSDFWLDPQRFGSIFGNGIIDHDWG